MEYLPLFINLKNRPVLVIGGGIVAARKIQLLHRTGAVIRITAPVLCSELEKKLVTENNISWIGKRFKSTMLDDVILVVVATNDSDLNSIVYKIAEERHILINTVDNQDKCSCIFPAIIDRSPILIGISSGGTTPVLSRILREKIELLVPKSIGKVAKFAGEWRNVIKHRIINPIIRRRFWEKIFYNSHIFTIVEKGNFEKVPEVFKNALNIINDNDMQKGSVTLVGAGPGNQGLLTIRGLQVIQQADIVLYDALVSKEILDLVRRDARKIYVGKCSGKYSISQKKINQYIIQLAKSGNKVVRLKGGDPFIFGRGGEELQKISEAGIVFQVVPGITSGIGAAAYAGIPLTHREYAHSVTFITGHLSNDNYSINWNNLSDRLQTLVVYMGTLNAENISKNLIDHGRDISTPVAVISKGTYYDQKVMIGTLIELAKLTQMVEKPILLVIGDVVSLYRQIHWFGKNFNDYKVNSIVNLI